MQLSCALVTALAGGWFGFGCLVPGAGTTAAGGSAPIEVVFERHRPMLVCDGCTSSVTDSIAIGENRTYPCANGEQWTLVLGTPVTGNGKCDFVQWACATAGACTYERSAIVTLDPANGTCPLYYRANADNGPYSTASSGQSFGQSLAAACEGGPPTQQICKDYNVEFYDSTFDGNMVVFHWNARVCCSRCPL